MTCITITCQIEYDEKDVYTKAEAMCEFNETLVNMLNSSRTSTISVKKKTFDYTSCKEG